MYEDLSFNFCVQVCVCVMCVSMCKFIRMRIFCTCSHSYMYVYVRVFMRQEAEGPVAAQIQETVDDMNEVIALIRFMS